MRIEIDLPPEMEPLKADLQYFMQTMVRKLHINRHKKYIEGKDLSYFHVGVHNELDELDKAIANESQFNVALEAIDVANQSFLVAAKVWQMDKAEFMANKGVVTA